MTRLTIATPEILRPDVVQLAVCIGWIEGYSPAEWENSISAKYQDQDGNPFYVSSFEASNAFISRAVIMGPVDRPPQDVGDLDPDTGQPLGTGYKIDLDAARNAQSKLVIWQQATPDPETGEMPDNPIPQVSQDKVVVIVGMKGPAAIAAAGLQTIPMDV